MSWNQFSLIRNLIRAMTTDTTAKVGATILIAFAFIAIFANFIAPRPFDEQNLSRALIPPSLAFPLGTDYLGRDILSRIIYGSRITFYIIALTSVIALGIGIPFGLVAGYFGAVSDAVISRITDVLLAFPNLLLALAFVVILGTGLENAAIAIGVALIPTYVRLARGLAILEKEHLYVEAARAMGLSRLSILRTHLFHNIIGPLIVQATLSVGSAILGVASLSFLGLGAQPPTPEWGAMLQEGGRYMIDAPFIIISPGVAILLTVLSLNIIGESLRDVYDPKHVTSRL